MKNAWISLLLGVLLASCNAPPKLVWADEFDFEGVPDSTKWSYDLGDGCPHVCGWGNNEAQYYTQRTKNVRIENGNLVIEAHQNSINGRAYSSARIISKHKGDWLYGRVEVRAKLPKGRGTWPAIWMLPTDWKYGGWPTSGEIDIMEHVGYDQGVIHGTLHCKKYNHIQQT
ncbi:MAG: family 16 glycosylhydrolase, partial [Bacteroidota bacterium]